jgi:hypothetical protein
MTELRAVARAAEAVLPTLRVPTLYMQSREDNRISEADARRHFAAIGSPDKVTHWLIAEAQGAQRLPLRHCHCSCATVPLPLPLPLIDRGRRGSCRRSFPKKKCFGEWLRTCRQHASAPLRLCDKAVRGSRFAGRGSTVCGRNSNYAIAETQGAQRLVSSRSLRFPKRKDFGEWLRTCREQVSAPLRLCDRAVCSSQFAVRGSWFVVRGSRWRSSRFGSQLAGSIFNSNNGIAETQGAQRLVSNRSLRFPKRKDFGEWLRTCREQASATLRLCASAIEQFGACISRRFGVSAVCAPWRCLNV